MTEAVDRTNTTPSQMYGHVLRPEELLRRARYGSAEPAEDWSRWVERYWSVQWSLAEGESFPVSTLDDPSVNLTRERGGVRRSGTDGAGSWVTGPVTRGLFDVVLLGEGSVVGVKLRIGAVRALDLPAVRRADMRSLRDRTIPARTWFGDQDLPEDLPAEAAIAAPHLDAWLSRIGLREPEGYEEFRRVLALLESPEVIGLADLEARSGYGTRTLQRLFDGFAGVSPTRMLRRARVMDALAAIDRGDPRSMGEIAHDLGWFDQSHFIRDVRAITGRTPARYASQEERS